MNRIETFDDLYDATYYIETLALESEPSLKYFKAELTRLTDGRYRVGIVTDGQLELKFD